MAFTLGHLSDVHLGPLPSVRAVDLFSKRVTGYINWRRNRASQIVSGTLGTLVNALQAKHPDHIAVTGDLTNLALDAEIANAAIWLQSLGAAEDVSVVPGNHDAYVPGALDKAVAAWKCNIGGDDTISGLEVRRSFPYLRVREPLAIIGINSAVATAPFMASGRFGTWQAKSMAALLEEASRKGLFRVVLIHHPPVRKAAVSQKRLYGIRAFQSVVERCGAELVLHGHTHLPQRHHIAGPDGTRVPVLGVPAGGQAPGHGKPSAAFNLFHIDGSAGEWKCRFEQYAVTGQTGRVNLTHKSELYG